MILRDYQQQAVDSVRRAVTRRPLLVMPTGAGKTVTASSIVRESGLDTLWLAHRRELVFQAAQTLERYGLDVGITMAGSESTGQPVQVASVQTVARRGVPFVPRLVVIDEAHHVTAGTYKSILERVDGANVLGLTATPFRLDGRGLGDAFDTLIVAAYTDQLCADGTLVEPLVYAPALPDMTGVGRKGSDYDVTELAEAMSKPRLVGDLVRTWKQRAEGKRTAVFAVNVEHSHRIVESFRLAGVAAEHLDGKTSRAQRDAILHRLRIGYTTVVSNCQVLTEGWDLPALEVAVIARPTLSLCLHLQMIGRIMRCAKEKVGAIVLDHAGNHHRHGFVTQRIDYSLDGAPKQRRGEQPDCKQCPACFLMVDLGALACPGCGHIWTRAQRQLEHVDGELVKLSAAEARAAMTLDDQIASWDRIEYRRRQLGYAEGWSFYQFRHLHGFSPLIIGGQLVDGKRATKEQKRTHYRELQAIARQRAYKRGWVSHRYKAAFGVWPRGMA